MTPGRLAVLGRWSVVKLLDRHAPEDPILAAVDLPRAFDIAVAAIGGAIVAISVVGSLVMVDGDDRLNLGVAALVTVPWLAWIARGCRDAAKVAPYVLAPAAAVTVCEVATPDGTVGFAPQFLLYLCLLALVCCVFAPRRHVTLVAAATGAVLVVRGLVSPEPAATLTPWLVAVTFVVAGIVGVRVGGLSIARAQQATAEQAELDDRRRVAGEVHDAVAHTLAVTLRHVAAARAAVDRAAVDDAVGELEEAERHGRASLADVRRTIRVLRTGGGRGDMSDPGRAAPEPGPTAPPTAPPTVPPTGPEAAAGAAAVAAAGEARP